MEKLCFARKYGFLSFLVKIVCSIRSFNTGYKMYQNATSQIYYLAVEMYLFKDMFDKVKYLLCLFTCLQIPGNQALRT